jgi:hypothetical protein
VKDKIFCELPEISVYLLYILNIKVLKNDSIAKVIEISDPTTYEQMKVRGNLTLKNGENRTKTEPKISDS